MTPENGLLIMWITFTFLGVAGIALVLVWAVRSGQFSDQDRARRLPLPDSGSEPTPTEASESRMSHVSS
jgi:cbb3-type cytochrome oxidase maturation protein